MKQYTTPEQTAKLIKLGFEKPKLAAPSLKWVDGEPTFEPQYTIGELIGIIHSRIIPISIIYDNGGFNNAHYKIRVFIDSMWCTIHERDNAEMIDFLFEAIVKLKEERII